ncbi:MAG: hypothetical protein HY673_13835 [Chloroflexi bacterium]|nr:hypothetical protein [Chloroflexota bacterium]
MTDNLSFFLDNSTTHLEKGLAAQRQGNLPEARYNLLKAAEFLFKAAEKTPPPLKEKRLERAQPSWPKRRPWKNRPGVRPARPPRLVRCGREKPPNRRLPMPAIGWCGRSPT